MTTPDQYPLTVNALMSACNQSTSRVPVVRYSEHAVNEALTSLRSLGLTRVVHSTSNRAAKHRQVASEVWNLDEPAHALMTVLMLRSAQTVGELKTRTERMHTFSSLGEVETVLDALAAREEPLVVRLPRAPGQKDARYVHLLSGTPDVEALDTMAAAPTGAAAVRADRIAELEAAFAASVARIDDLEARIAQLEELLN